MSGTPSSGRPYTVVLSAAQKPYAAGAGNFSACSNLPPGGIRLWHHNLSQGLVLTVEPLPVAWEPWLAANPTVSWQWLHGWFSESEQLLRVCGKAEYLFYYLHWRVVWGSC